MKQYLLACISACLLTLLSAQGSSAAVTVPVWMSPPNACLPDRALPWDDALGGEANQVSCHCPPTSKCPNPNVTSWTQYWLDKNFPEQLTLQCCEKPRCAAGTRQAGQLLPADGKCNICPAGTDFAGQNVAPPQPCNEICPAGSDREGERIADIRQAMIDAVPEECINWSGGENGGCMQWARNQSEVDRINAIPAFRLCNPDVCPPGTPLASQPMPLDRDCSCPQHLQTYYTMTFSWSNSRVVYTNSGTCGCPAWAPIATPMNKGTMAASFGGAFSEQYLRANGTAMAAVDIPNNFTYCFMPPRRGDCIGGESVLIREDGTEVAIADIKVGDKIMGPEGVAVVTQTNKLDSPSVTLYQINDVAMTITGEHPLLTKRGWAQLDPMLNKDGTKPIRLEIGDVLLTQSGEVKVTSIERVKQPKTTDAYNINTVKAKPFYAGGVAIKPFTNITFGY